MYGKNNTGPAREVWVTGDRVRYLGQGADHGQIGRVGPAPRDPVANEVGHVWVDWEDGFHGYTHPNLLDAA